MTNVVNNKKNNNNHGPANDGPGLTAEALAQLPVVGPNNRPPNPNSPSKKSSEDGSKNNCGGDTVDPWCICFPSDLKRWFKLRLADGLQSGTTASEVDIEKTIPVFNPSLNELSGAALSKKILKDSVLIRDCQLKKIGKYLWAEIDECLERIKNSVNNECLDAAEQDRQFLISLVCLLPDEILHRHPLGRENEAVRDFIAKLREFKSENKASYYRFCSNTCGGLCYQQRQCDMLLRLGVVEEVDFETVERIRTTQRAKTNAAGPRTSSSSSDDTTDSDSTDSESSDRSPNRESSEDASDRCKHFAIGSVLTLFLAFLLKTYVFDHFCAKGGSSAASPTDPRVRQKEELECVSEGFGSIQEFLSSEGTFVVTSIEKEEAMEDRPRDGPTAESTPDGNILFHGKIYIGLLLLVKVYDQEVQESRYPNAPLSILKSWISELHAIEPEHIKVVIKLENNKAFEFKDETTGKQALKAYEELQQKELRVVEENIQ